MIPATSLAPLVNAYTIRTGPPKAILVPKASSLAILQDVTVGGTLLAKQVVSLNPATGRRTVALGANGGKYGIEADGDLHFCVGGRALTPHVTCELQHATAWLPTFQAAIGTAMSASGWFRCLFEHPGFAANDDAHIFEIHPVRAVALAGVSQAFDVDLPDPASIHTWTSPHPLNVQDGKIRASYDRAADTLTFTNMDGQDENYVSVPGAVSQVTPGAGGAPSTCTLTSPDIGHPIEVIALAGTRAARQLASLAAVNVTLVGLRNIDLRQALTGRYVINLLAIDIQPGP
ncbi:MAG TPA: hypothetical protein VEY12_04520 [Thermoplasmata archaeon]|nr:hypothetical protein [Thermoplasmata archaeon]